MVPPRFRLWAGCVRVSALFLMATAAGIRSQPTQNRAPAVLTIEDAVRICLENNYSLSLSRDQAAVAGNNRAAGIGPFLPEASASLNRSGRLDGSASQTTVGGSLNLMIFDGFQSYHAYRRLQYQEKAAALQARSALETTLESVLAAYYESVRQKQRLEAVQELLAVSEARAELSQARMELGAGSRLEQLQATADLNEDSSTFLSQQISLGDAKTKVNQILARDPAAIFDVSDSIPLETSLPVDQWRASLSENNSAILQARAQRGAAGSGLSEAKGGHWPDLNAGLSYSAAPGALNSGPTSPASGNGTVGYSLNLSMPIFDGLRTHQQVGNARLELRQGETRLKQAEADALAEFEQSRQKHVAGLHRVSLEERNLEVSRLQAEAAREKFRAGASSSLEFRDAQQRLLEAHSRLLAARQDTKLAELALKRLAGALVREVPAETAGK